MAANLRADPEEDSVLPMLSSSPSLLGAGAGIYSQM